MNMLLTEWNMEDALAVRFEEGMEKGWSMGREEGREEGWSEGRSEFARNALINGLSLDTISAITGMDIADIKRLAAHQ
jgi:predicted transposase/invertase (TIGR01784 family)